MVYLVVILVPYWSFSHKGSHKAGEHEIRPTSGRLGHSEADPRSIKSKEYNSFSWTWDTLLFQSVTSHACISCSIDVEI